MQKYSEALKIKERQRIVRKYSKRGLSAGKISRLLSKVKDGIYAASKETVYKDLKDIVKKQDHWDKIHNPNKMDAAQAERKKLIEELDLLIENAKEKKQFKTAGELIGKKARLLGIDKYVAPKSKKKSLLEEKYQYKSPEEINEVLFQDFKDLAAALIRMAREKQLGNIRRVSLSLLREISPGKTVRFIVSRFGEEKQIIKEQEKLK